MTERVITKTDNSPPAFEAISMEVEELFSLASGSLAAGPVSTDEQEAALDGLLDDIRKTRKLADEERAAEKKPHADAAKAVDDKWRDVIARCDAGTKEIKTALTPYRTAKQQAKDAAAAKAREEAEAIAKAAQDALREADDLEAKYAAETQLGVAQKLTAVANKIDRSATGLRTFWEPEITDKRAALLHYIQRSPERFEALIEQLAAEDARGARAPVPGITFHERKRAA